MKVKTTKGLIVVCSLMLGCFTSNAQFNDFLNYPLTVTPHESVDSTRGHFWGYMFGSYYAKTHADSLQRGNTQYSGNLAKGANEFSLDRVYLGYDYFFNQQFSVHAVMAYEETSNVGFQSVTTLEDYDRAFYLKYANMEWNNMFHTGLKLSVGSITTPSFAITEEPFWGYRSIDRTIMDMKGITGSNDLGVNIGGKIWRKKNADGTENACVGFNLMVGNGTGPIPDIPGITADYNYGWKKYYGDLYVKMFHDKILLDLYGDGHTYAWTPVPDQPHDIHQYEITGRAFLGYKTKKFDISVEYFEQMNENMVGEKSGPGVPAAGDTSNDIQNGFSLMSAAVLFRNKKTGATISAYARFDFYNPFSNYNPDIAYESSITVQSRPVSFPSPWVEDYIVAGIDYQPIKQIHLMPNIWFDGIHDGTYDNIPSTATDRYDYDLVYRITFYYQFFKN